MSVLQPWWWFWRDAPVVVSQADGADAFAKIGNIFPQKLPQTNKGTSGIYGNRNKTDFSGPVKFLLLSPPPKGMKFVACVSSFCGRKAWCRVKSLLMFVPLAGYLGSKVENLGSKPIFCFQTFATTGDSATFVHDSWPANNFSLFRSHRENSIIPTKSFLE